MGETLLVTSRLPPNSDGVFNSSDSSGFTSLSREGFRITPSFLVRLVDRYPVGPYRSVSLLVVAWGSSTRT